MGRPSGPPRKKSPRQTLVESCVLGLVLAMGAIFLLELRLRPMVQTIAQAQATNLITATIASSIASQDIDYSQFIHIQQNQAGEITALSSNMTAMNQMRSQLIDGVLLSLEEVDVSVIQVPVGSLLESELLWAKGPSLQARSMSVGTIVAQFHSEFTQAGINQTLHRIYLQISAPITLMMAGDTLETVVEQQICVSETVIVGSVPNTNFQMGSPFLESSLTFTPIQPW